MDDRAEICGASIVTMETQAKTPSLTCGKGKNPPPKLQQHLGGSMNDLLKRAESFARIRHMGQFRKGKIKEPHTIHLEEVAALVES